MCLVAFLSLCISSTSIIFYFFFFFQAEDGIRDSSVTGVQTCALPIFATGFRWAEGPVYFRDGGYLLWSDIPNNRIMRWSEDDGHVSVYRYPSNYSKIGRASCRERV